MIQAIWYAIIKKYVDLVLFFYFKKRIIRGKENIPKKGAVLLVSNHKNALIDPLIIATPMHRSIHFLTRASAFKIGFVKWLLSTINMMPIYRMRDGKETLARNEEIFNKCFDILAGHKCLLIFPEGTHDVRRLVRPLSKGFTRIVFGFLEKHPDTGLHIVPIGLNYTDATRFAESVSVVFGKPILADPFYRENDIFNATNDLKAEVSARLRELTVHIEPENYDDTLEKLGNVDFTDHEKVNKLIADIGTHNPDHEAKKPSLLWKALKALMTVNSLFPYLVYKKFEPKIKEPEFISTTKFAIGASAFPLFYILQSLAVAHFFGIQTGLIYLAASLVLALLVVKTK